MLQSRENQVNSDLYRVKIKLRCWHSRKAAGMSGGFLNCYDRCPTTKLVPPERSLVSSSIAVAVLGLEGVLVAIYALIATVAVIVLAARFGIERFALGHIRVRHFGSIAVTIAESGIAAKGSLRVASLVSGIGAAVIDSPTVVNSTTVVNTTRVINAAPVVNPTAVINPTTVINAVVGVTVAAPRSLIVLVNGRVVLAIAVSPVA